MQPAYQERDLVFTRNGNIIESNGMFFYPEYVKTPLGKRDSGLRTKKMIGMMFFASKTAYLFTVPSSNMVMNLGYGQSFFSRALRRKAITLNSGTYFALICG